MHRIEHSTTTWFCKDDFKKLHYQYPTNYTQNRLYCKKQYSKSTSRQRLPCHSRFPLKHSFNKKMENDFFFYCVCFRGNYSWERGKVAAFGY